MSNEEVLSAKLVGADPLTDLAVIKINGNDFPSVPWATRPICIPDKRFWLSGIPTDIASR